MESAFGIDHGYISKSFVPGGSLLGKPASMLSGTERGAIKAKHAQKVADLEEFWGKGNAKGHSTQRPLLERGINIRRTGRKVPGGVGTSNNTIKVIHNPNVVPHPTIADKYKGGSAVSNGRGGGTITLHPHPLKNTPEDKAAVLRHEIAHIQVNRNPMKAGARQANHLTRGREEGRADYLAHGKRTPGMYPGNEEFHRGYNEVQNKIHASRQNPLWKPKKQRKLNIIHETPAAPQPDNRSPFS